MLLIAAALTFVLGCIHSYMGEKNLIQPILRMDGLPVILGSLLNTKATLQVVWHMATLFMWGIAIVLIFIHFDSIPLNIVVLWTVAVLFTLFGLAALILSRGAHKSWVVFLPVAAIAVYSALTL